MIDSLTLKCLTKKGEDCDLVNVISLITSGNNPCACPVPTHLAKVMDLLDLLLQKDTSHRNVTHRKASRDFRFIRRSHTNPKEFTFIRPLKQIDGKCLHDTEVASQKRLKRPDA